MISPRLSGRCCELRKTCSQAPRSISTLKSSSRQQKCSSACHALGQMQGCRLSGVGSSVPSTILTNKDLESFVDTNDDWIVSRTGIKQRHILGKGETLGGLAVTASLKALEMAGVAAADIDLVLFATSSPDDLFGGACQVRATAAGQIRGSASVTSHPSFRIT